MKTKKIISTGKNCRRDLINGINKVCDCVSTTLGPRGKNAIIERKGMSPLVTNDGVTIAREISVLDDFENLGVSLIKEVANKTQDSVGDGTTTSIILASSIINKIVEFMDDNESISFLNLEDGMQEAIKEVFLYLDKTKIDIDINECGNVAYISSSGDKNISNIIKTAYEEVGRDGIIEIEESNQLDTTIEVVKGSQFNEGYLSEYMKDTDSNNATLEKPYILVTDYKINYIQEILPILDKVTKEKKSILIIASDFSPSVLATLSMNNAQGNLRSIAVKAPETGNNQKDFLKDISIITNSEIVTSVNGKILQNTEINFLGSCERVICTKSKTTIIGGSGSKENIEKRINDIKSSLEDENKIDATTKRRLSLLKNGICNIKVGGLTKSEIQERKMRIEDALSATKQSLLDGVVIGGGMSLLNASNEISIKNKNDNDKYTDFEMGKIIIRDCLKTPFEILCRNSYIDYNKALETVRENPLKINGFGYDFKNNITGDMFRMGVIEPTNVVKVGLLSAISIAVLVMRTNTIIADITEEPKELKLLPLQQPLM